MPDNAEITGPGVTSTVTKSLDFSRLMMGNQNATKHGIDAVKGNPLAVSLYRLPKGSRFIATAVNQFREALHAVMPPTDDAGLALLRAGLIDTACRWEVVSRLAMRWLGLRGESMSDADRLNYARMFAWASERRDAAMKALGLGGDAMKTIADILYGSRLTLSPGATLGDEGPDSGKRGLTRPAATCQNTHDEGDGNRVEVPPRA
jgi:hypothetical protein